MFVRCDVSDEDEICRAFDQTVSSYGHVDIVVANVGGSSGRELLVDMSLDMWNSAIQRNLTSTFLCFRAGAQHMIERGRAGALLAISSAASVQASPRAAHYAAAKSGLGGLVRSVAHELAPYRIRCNALVPGFTAVERMAVGDLPKDRADQINASIPAGRWGTPEEVAQAALFLCDPSLSYHTGVELRADGGLTVMASQEAAAATWDAAADFFAPR
jgi:NAD(P)-dependent dehydrogenase (short-subunit alcohol dehydrogenase family)